jgi:hypothetical protein
MLPEELLTEFNSTLINNPNITKHELHAYLLALSHETEMIPILHWIWYTFALKSVKEYYLPVFQKTQHVRKCFQHRGAICLTATLDTLIGVHHSLLVDGNYNEKIVHKLLYNVKQRLYYLLTRRLSATVLNEENFVIRKKQVKKTGYTKRQLADLIEAIDLESKPEIREEAIDFETEVNELCIFYVSMYLIDIDRYSKEYEDIKDKLVVDENVVLSNLREYMFSKLFESESGALLDTLNTLYYKQQVRRADYHVYRYRNPNRGGEPTPLMLINMKNVELINMEITSLKKMKKLILTNDKYMKLFTDAAFILISRKLAYQNKYVDVFLEAEKYIKYEPIACQWYFKLNENTYMCNPSFTGAFVLSRKYGLGDGFFDEYF